MSEARIAVLSDRDVVSVRGLDARKLLDSVITNDMDVLDDAPAIFSGLLTPQGKILFDFFVVAANDGFLIDVAASYAADFVKRLILYRLRAKVEINGPVEGQCVVAIWGPGGGAAALLNGVTAWTDPRDPRLGQRAILPAGEVAIAANIADAQRGSEADHQAHRIGLGVAEGAKDYDFGDTFPHEANFDLLHGVSFEKGCYVGQEIVARMEHRGTVRKRVVRVMGARDLSPGRPNVTMGDVVIGRLGSVAGRTGMALVRLDRAIEAIDKGQAITADGVELNIDAEMIARQRHLMAVKAAST